MIVRGFQPTGCVFRLGHLAILCGTRERPKITSKNSCAAYKNDKFLYTGIREIKLKRISYNTSLFIISYSFWAIKCCLLNTIH